jgi:uncharacterized protein (DUF1330 family)
VDQSAVIVEFESLEKAIAAYESDLYRIALKVLDNAAQRDFRVRGSLNRPTLSERHMSEILTH